jgi:hypothetical protein
MPTAIKIISTINILLTSVFIANLLLIHHSNIEVPVFGSPLISFINLAGASVLILTALVVLLRWVKLVGFIRLLNYVLLLLLGLNILLMAKYIFSLYGIFTILFNVFAIVYLIGVRGYLASEKSAHYFTTR